MATTEPRTSPGRKAIWPGDGVPKPLMPYSPVITAGGWVFTAGQLATDFDTGLAPEATPNPGPPYYEDALNVAAREGEFGEMKISDYTKVG